MIVYHVTGMNKLIRYRTLGYIKPPVRAWRNIKAAEYFSKQTGRPIILRLNFPKNVEKLEGHKGMAVILDKPYRVDNILGWGDV